MSWFSKAFDSIKENKTAGKLAGFAAAPFAPIAAVADVAGKSVKGLNNPFTKGMAQGARAGLGTAAVVGGAMIGLPALAGSSAAAPATAGETVGGSVVTSAAPAESSASKLASSLINAGTGVGKSSINANAQAEEESSRRLKENFDRELQAARQRIMQQMAIKKAYTGIQ
jgi:hypothetical protein